MLKQDTRDSHFLNSALEKSAGGENTYVNGAMQRRLNVEKVNDPMHQLVVEDHPKTCT